MVTPTLHRILMPPRKRGDSLKCSLVSVAITVATLSNKYFAIQEIHFGK